MNRIRIHKSLEKGWGSGLHVTLSTKLRKGSGSGLSVKRTQFRRFRVQVCLLTVSTRVNRRFRFRFICEPYLLNLGEVSGPGLPVNRIH